jgi:hypothetical protein
MPTVSGGKATSDIRTDLLQMVQHNNVQNGAILSIG